MPLHRNLDLEKETKWYSKNIASNRMINYSKHPYTMKINFAKSFAKES